MHLEKVLELSRGVLELMHEGEQARARIADLELYLFGKPELWAVHLPARDELLPMPSKLMAENYAETVCKVAGEGAALVIHSVLPFDVHMHNACKILAGLASRANDELAKLTLEVQFLRLDLARYAVPVSESETATAS